MESVPIQLESDPLSFSEDGQLLVYQTEVSLETGDAFDLRFDLHGGDADGGLLFIDLYADGYDLEEAECRYSVTEDIYSVNKVLHFGNNHPRKCMLRVFSTGDINAKVDNIRIDRLKYSTNGIGIVAILFALISSSLLVFVGFGNTTKRGRVLLVLGIVVLQSLTMSYWLSRKTNCYVDELYSLNGAHQFTSVSADSGYIYEQWDENIVDAGDLKQRLAVNEGESVLDQPFLRQVSSFFRGRNYYWILNLVETLSGRGGIHVYSPIILNILFVILTELLLLYLLKHIGVGEGLSLLAVMWYGYTGMTVSNAMYIRVYTFAVLLFILLLFMHAHIWNSDKIRDWIIVAMLTMLTIYIGYLDSELILPLGAVLVVLFSIGLLLRRRWKQFLLYGAPILVAGIIMTSLISPAFDMLSHSGEYVSRALAFGGVGDIDRTDEMMYLIHFSSPEAFLQKIRQCIQLLETYLFGNTVMMFAVVMMLMGLGLFYFHQKRKKHIEIKKTTYEGFILIILLLFVIYTVFSAIALNVVLRYYSYVCPLIIILVVWTMNRIKAVWNKTVTGIAIGVVAISCLVTLLTGNIEYLYAGDETLHDSLEDYREEEALLITDVPSFQRSVYEAVLYMDEKAKLRQMKMVEGAAEDNEATIKREELPETFLLWTFPNRDIAEHLRWISDSGYRYEVLGSNSAAEVYVCERQI